MRARVSATTGLSSRARNLYGRRMARNILIALIVVSLSSCGGATPTTAESPRVEAPAAPVAPELVYAAPTPAPGPPPCVESLDRVLACSALPTRATGESDDLEQRRLICANRTNADSIAAIYRLGRARLDAEQFGEAAALFDAIVAQAPDSEYAGHAATMSLEALHARVYNDPDTRDCRAELEAHLPSFRTTLCVPPRQQRVEEACQFMTDLTCRLRAMHCHDLESTNQYAEASAAYESLANAPECAQHEPEIYLYNAAVLASRAGDTARATALGAQLPRRFPNGRLRWPHP